MAGDVLLSQDAEKVRVALRVYFTVLLVLVAYLGSRICALRPLVALRQQKRVPIMHLTGWLSAFDAVRTMWVSRSNPLGFMGVLMVLAGSLLTVTDIAVSGLVVTASVQERCLFNTSNDEFLVFPSKNTSTNVHYPNSLSYVPFMIREATSIAKRNGGVMGIFNKVNRAENFCPEAQDVYGGWECKRADNGTSQIYKFDFDPVEVLADLASKGLAFYRPRVIPNDPGAQFYFGVYHTDPELNRTLTSNFVALSHSADELALAQNPAESRTPLDVWDIMVNVEDGEDISLRTDMSLATYRCKLNAPSAEWAMKLTFAIILIGGWGREVFAQVYTGVPAQPWNTGTKLVDNVEEVLEEIFNNMIMATGMLEYRTAEDIEDMTHGCRVDKARIPWPVVLLFVLAAMLLFGFAGHAGYLAISVERAKSKFRPVPRDSESSSDGEYPDHPQGLPYVPVGFLSWMKHAIKKRTEDDHIHSNSAAGDSISAYPLSAIKSKSLKHFDFAMDDERGRTEFVTRTPAEMWERTGRKTRTFDVFLGSSRRSVNSEDTGDTKTPRKLRKANTTLARSNARRASSTTIVARGSVAIPQRVLSAETLVSPLESPSIEARHWSNPSEAVSWAGGLRQELERVGSREGLVPEVEREEKRGIRQEQRWSQRQS